MRNISETAFLGDVVAVATTAGAVRSAMRARWRDFLELTKPRMNFLVLVTTAVGFYMARQPGTPWPGLMHVLLGTALTAASASVLNQLTERHYDGMMSRTRNRPLPARRIAAVEAAIFGTVLGIAGIMYLGATVNALTSLLGAGTLACYVLLYTPLKRITTLCTLVGALPGAIPPVMGMTAVGDVVWPKAMALFAILFLWQMPHFLAIAILYRDDYRAGGFCMLPCVDEDLRFTVWQMLLYAAAVVLVSLVPAALGMAGGVYLASAAILGAAFVTVVARCAWQPNRQEARKVFIASIIYLPALLAMMMLDR